MPKKKVAVSGFTILMKEMQEDIYHSTGKRPPLHEMKIIAEPKWMEMSAEEKSEYNAKAKGYKKDVLQITKKLASDGTVIEENKEREMEEEKKTTQMVKDIQQYIGSFQNTNVTDNIAKKHIYIITSNILVATDDGDHIPIEVSCVRYSISEGIINSYHQIINPGLPPPGYAGEAKSHSEETHKLLSEEKKALREFGKSNLEEIWREIYSFMALPTRELPPFFCMPDSLEQNEGCLKWILKRAGDPERIANKLKIWNLAKLLVEMRHAVEPEEATQTCGISYYQAIELLKKNTFDYEPDTRCEFHEDIDSRFCALGHAKRLCFLMSDTLCDVYNITKTGAHLPCVKMMQNVCEVYNPYKIETKNFLEREVPEIMASQAADSSRASYLSCLSSRLDELETLSDDESNFSYSSASTVNQMARMGLGSDVQGEYADSLPQFKISSSTFFQLKNKTSSGAPVVGLGRGRSNTKGQD